MIDLAVDPSMQNPAVPVDLACVGVVCRALILDEAVHSDLSRLEIAYSEDSLSTARSLAQFVPPSLLVYKILGHLGH